MNNVFKKFDPAFLLSFIRVICLDLDTRKQVILKSLEYWCCKDKSGTDVIILFLFELVFRVMHVFEHLFGCGAKRLLYFGEDCLVSSWVKWNITVYISFELSEIFFYCIDVGLDSSVLAFISFLLALTNVLQCYFHPILVTIYFLTELNAQI